MRTLGERMGEELGQPVVVTSTVGAGGKKATAAAAKADADGYTLLNNWVAPQIAGKLVIKFVIAKDGSVSNSNVKTTTLDSPAVETCVAARFMRMQFPEPAEGTVVKVTYPFEFRAE